MKKSILTILIIGFALFSMLFGAGNVIFPPYLGLGCGSQWGLGFTFYYLADIGLALVALFAVQRSGGHEAIIGPVGKVPATILMCLIILCIGPMVGIPRTAASTLELSVLPLFPQMNAVLFSLFFFAIIALLCLRESAVVDIIGKVLTPLLIVGLLILIVKGVVDPIGAIPDRVLVENVPVTGIEAGYQTMDVLAIVIFGIIIGKNIIARGYKTRREQNWIVFGAGAVAGLFLLLVYLGLTYLGVTASDMFDLTVDRTVLVTAIVQALLGRTGTILFGVVVALACVTTAVALVTATADYFCTLSGGRIKYTWLVIAICAFSGFVSTFGLNQIISIAGPILDVVYPPTLVLLFLSFFEKRIKTVWVYRLGALGAFATSALTVCMKFGAPLGFMAHLPLYSFGFSWILPAAICAVLGCFVPVRQTNTETLEGQA